MEINGVQGEGTADVSWNEVPGATQYVVFIYFDGVYTLGAVLLISLFHSHLSSAW